MGNENVSGFDLPMESFADGEYSVAIGSGAHTRERGEIQFAAEGKAKLQLFPDGRILVNGRPAGSDADVVLALRDWLCQMGLAEPLPSADLYRVERSHLDGLRAVAARLSVVANERNTMGEEELRNMSLIIMQAVRFAEVLEAFRRPGAPPTVVCELPRKP